MARRTALPSEAMEVTPGYSWRLDLDVTFDGERPTDWPDWIVRMHVWGDGIGFTLAPGDGVTFEPVDDVPDVEGAVVLPVIRMSAEQSERLRGAYGVHYLIDLQAPDGPAEDYWTAPLGIVPGPPGELLR